MSNTSEAAASFSLSIQHLRADLQLADALTKPLSPTRLRSLCSKLNMGDSL